MFCKNCGNQLPDGTAFCNNCGAAQNAPAPQPAPVAEQPISAPAPAPVAPVAPPTPVAGQPVSAPAPQPAPVAPVASQQPAPVQPPVAPPPMAQMPQGYVPAPVPAPAKKGHKGLIIAICIVLVVAILGGTAWVLYDNGTFDDWFGGSASSSEEDKKDESKDNSSDSSSNSGSTSADPNGTASEEGVNSELNQGTPVTPPTTSTPATDAAAYTPGYIDENGNYMNPWANLQYRVGEYQVATNPGVSMENGAEVGVMVMDTAGNTFNVSFVDNSTAGFANETAYFNSYLTTLTATYEAMGFTVNTQPTTTVTMAGEQYLSTTLSLTSTTLGNAAVSVHVREKDNHFILIAITGQNQLALNTMGNRLHSIS